MSSAARVGLILLSHGPLADALRSTVQVLEPDETSDVAALSLGVEQGFPRKPASGWSRL